mgnify:CR=1 FL=1
MLSRGGPAKLFCSHYYYMQMCCFAFLEWGADGPFASHDSPKTKKTWASQNRKPRSWLQTATIGSLNFFSYLMLQWISLFRSRATMSSPSIFHHSFTSFNVAFSISGTSLKLFSSRIKKFVDRFPDSRKIFSSRTVRRSISTCLLYTSPSPRD